MKKLEAVTLCVLMLLATSPGLSFATEMERIPLTENDVVTFEAMDTGSLDNIAAGIQHQQALQQVEEGIRKGDPGQVLVGLLLLLAAGAIAAFAGGAGP